jgi:hypothetical protein
MKNKKLKVGDIVIVSTVLGGESEYPVLSVNKNNAHTQFRDFSTTIYPGGYVYEFGKRAYSTTNSYWIKNDTN